MTRINDKITEISRFLEELEKIAPSSLEEYKPSLEKKAACERYAEKIVEAATDLAFLIIKLKKLRMPEDDIDSFNILMENDVISKDLAAKLKNAKGMKNIISHQYGKIDDEIVFESIKKELDRDVKDFISVVEKMYI